MKVNSDLRQRHLKNFAIQLKRRQPPEWDSIEDLPIAVYYDLYAQAAREAGWFEDEVSEEDIDNLKWPELFELVNQLVEAQNEAEKIEKN